MSDEQRPPALSESAGRVLDVIEAGGPEMPIVVVARLSGIPPTRLVPLLDELHEASLVTTGAAPQTVRLVPADDAGGRFRRSAPSTEKQRS